MSLKPDWHLLGAWCIEHLAQEPVEVLFEQVGSLSCVTGLRLADGHKVVVKVRPPAKRLDSCFAVQKHAWISGFPCPQPLVGPSMLGDLVATAEAFLGGGEYLEESAERPRLFAEALFELIQVASKTGRPLSLRPPHAWVFWDHHQGGLWPQPDDRVVNLNERAGPDDLEEIGARLSDRLRGDKGPRLLGHCDWWQPNLRWLNGRLHAVFDWDSTAELSEAALVGTAAAQFSISSAGATTPAETEAFIDAYERARGSLFSKDERQICWAAGLWLIAYNAKNEALDGNRMSLEHLKIHGAQRLRRAGL